MADEPNKRMDDALKAYAQKRRQDTPDPSGFDLHPATRAMLQGEVARTFKPAAEASWWRRTILLWPRVAFAAACVAVTVTLLLIVVPRQRMMEVAQTPGKSETVSRNERFDDVKQKEESLGALADAPTGSMAPIAPSAQPADKLSKAAEADEFKKSETMVEARKDTDRAVLLREEESTQAQAARRLYKNTSPQATARYNRQQAKEVQLGAKVMDSEAAQPFLNSFEFQQTGNEVRVIDEDGSIYVGNVISNVQARTRDVRLQNAPAAVSGDAAALPQEPMMFYAIGTNLSLRQKVSIEGNVLRMATNVAATPPPASAPTVTGGAAQVQNRPVAGPQNAIRGRARVGTNQEVYFEAVPAKP